MLSVLFFVFCLYGIWTLLFRKKRGLEPPELSGKLPLLGHALVLTTGNNYKRIIQFSEESLGKGGVVSGQFGYKTFYCITDPEAFLTISNTCLEKLYTYNFLKPLIGEGLITGNVRTWKKHRKLLSPMFNQQVLNSFIETFNSQARILVDRLAFQLGTRYDHEQLIRATNLETLCLTVTGVENNILKKTYLSAMPILQRCFNERLLKVWFHIDLIFNLSFLKRTQEAILKPYLIFSNAIIQKKKAEMKLECKTNIGTRKMKPFLELILDIANETQCFTDEEVREEADTIISAGYETSPSTLNIALMILGSYPDVQEKVYNELIQVCGSLDSDLDKDDLSKLVYTDAVLKETLRLYPIAPVIARRIDKDIKIKNYMLKRNSFCLLLIYGLNRHPVWGPDADQFKPERWLDMVTLPDMNTFGSFGVGKRNCIGRVYSMMSMKTTLVHVIRRYKVSADISKLVLNWHMTIYPEAGHHFILEQRQ